MESLSIIIPHYNSWDKLIELLNTIPNIEWIEVIVIDDKSENQKKRISKLKLKFPNVIFLANNSSEKGAGKARNLGLDFAKNDWVLFADSDDLFLPEMINLVKKYMNSSYDIVYFTPTSFIEHTEVISTRHKPYENYISNYLSQPSQYNEMKLRYYYVVPWSKLIRKNIVDKNSIRFEEIMVSNDLLFSAKVGFYANEIFATSEKIYSVRENMGSLTTDISEEKFDSRFDAWINYVNFLNDNLSKEKLKLLHISSAPQIHKVLSSKLGLRKLIEVVKKCKHYGIKIVDTRVFNPKFIVKKLVSK